MISLSAERRQETPESRAETLQISLCERGDKLDLPETVEDLYREMSRHLVNGSDEGYLATRPHDVFKTLKISDSPVGKPPAYRGIYGGEKDLKRRGDRPRFLRRDGAWFHFTITVRVSRGRPLLLIAYDFELCFPVDLAKDSAGFPRFVRFDLNEPAHGNESKGLRCHMHPGHDNLMVPAPLMSPLELLDLFVLGLRIPKDPRQA